MTEDTQRPGAIFEFYKDLFATTPTFELTDRLQKFTRTVIEAQIAYTRALAGANAEILGAWTDKPNPPDGERPSVAAKRNEVMTA